MRGAPQALAGPGGQARAGHRLRALAVEEPVNLDYFVVFKGLPEQVQLELSLGLQVRSDAGARTSIAALRPVVAVLRRTQAATVDDLDETLIKQGRHDASVLVRHLLTAVQRATTSPDEEQRNDVWDLAVLGLGGSLRFTEISQAWLRESAKQWAAETSPATRAVRPRTRQRESLPPSESCR